MKRQAQSSRRRTFKPRPQPIHRHESRFVTLRVPEEAWNVLAETLRLDASRPPAVSDPRPRRAATFNAKRRRSIAKALDQVERVDMIEVVSLDRACLRDLGVYVDEATDEQFEALADALNENLVGSYDLLAEAVETARELGFRIVGENPADDLIAYIRKGALPSFVSDPSPQRVAQALLDLSAEGHNLKALKRVRRRVWDKTFGCGLPDLARQSVVLAVLDQQIRELTRERTSRVPKARSIGDSAR